MRDDLRDICTGAGKIILEYRQKILRIEDKEKEEIVTAADLAANEYITHQLKKRSEYPIYSEEGEIEKSQNKDRWIIDPLDGTTPWVWGNSGWSISIALELDGIITAGAVFDPVMNEFYWAEKGLGATRNETPIHTADYVLPKKRLLVVDWGNKEEKRREGLSYFQKFFLPEMYGRKVVPQFAPALGLCRIAEGRIQGLICNDTWVEDHSAGGLILKEAGGYITNFYKRASFNHRESGIIAASDPKTHSELCNFLS